MPEVETLIGSEMWALVLNEGAMTSWQLIGWESTWCWKNFCFLRSFTGIHMRWSASNLRDLWY